MEYEPIEISKKLVTFSDMMVCDALSLPERIEAASRLDMLLLELVDVVDMIADYSDLILEYKKHPAIDDISLLSFTDIAVVTFVNKMHDKYIPDYFTLYRKHWSDVFVDVLNGLMKKRIVTPNMSMIVFDDTLTIEFYYHNKYFCVFEPMGESLLKFMVPIGILNKIVQNDSSLQKLIRITDTFNTNMNKLFDV